MGEKCNTLPVQSMRKAPKTQCFQGFVYDAVGGKTGYEGRETGDPGYEIEF